MLTTRLEMTLIIYVLCMIEGFVQGFTVNPWKWRRRLQLLSKQSNIFFQPLQQKFVQSSPIDSPEIFFGNKLKDGYIPVNISKFTQTITHDIHSSSNSLLGLSKIHQSLASTTYERQICVTGQYPLYISIKNNPTRRWIFFSSMRKILQSSSSVDSTMSSSTSTSSTSRLIPSTLQMLVNGTSIDRSLASYDRFQWLDDHERTSLHENHSWLSIEFTAEIDIRKPGFLHILPSSAAGSSASIQRRGNKMKHKRGENHPTTSIIKGNERLWITGFSLTQTLGEIHYLDIHNSYMGQLNTRTRDSIRWPNEVTLIPSFRYNNTPINPNGVIDYDDALLIADGFLVPGKDQGGIYVVSRPGHGTEWKVCLTGGQGVEGLLSKLENGDCIGNWFYHKAVWVDLTGDGTLSILAARSSNKGTYTNSPDDGSKEANLSSFRSQLVFLERPKPHKYDRDSGTALDVDGTVFDPFRHTPWKTHVLDEGPDVMFSVADLDTTDDTIEVIASQFFNRRITVHSIQRGEKPKVIFRRIIDDNCGSPFCTVLVNLDLVEYSTRNIIDSGSSIPTFKNGDSFSHVLVTNHESSSGRDVKNSLSVYPNLRQGGNMDGGSLFSYRIPYGKDQWKTKEWKRSVIVTGIYVREQILNMWNPGAPGLCYAFYPRLEEAECKHMRNSRPLICIAGDCSNKAIILRPSKSDQGQGDPSTSYSVMCEIDIGGTVGSLAVGYDDLPHASTESKGYAKIYIPSYEHDKVLVFSMGREADDT